MTSIFSDKNIRPDDAALQSVSGKTFPLWKELEAFTQSRYPESKGEWHYSGAKFGWSYRIKDRKRVILYLLPRDGFFKVAFVFGQKAADSIMSSQLPDSIKSALQEAVVHAEGRGIRLEVRDKKRMDDFKKLIEIKLSS